MGVIIPSGSSVNINSPSLVTHSRKFNVNFVKESKQGPQASYSSCLAHLFSLLGSTRYISNAELLGNGTNIGQLPIIKFYKRPIFSMSES